MPGPQYHAQIIPHKITYYQKEQTFNRSLSKIFHNLQEIRQNKKFTEAIKQFERQGIASGQ